MKLIEFKANEAFLNKYMFESRQSKIYIYIYNLISFSYGIENVSDFLPELDLSLDKNTDPELIYLITYSVSRNSLEKKSL
jgi:hypothetical protein